MLALKRLPLATVILFASGAAAGCDRDPFSAPAAGEAGTVEGQIRSVDLEGRALTLVDGRVLRLGPAASEADKDPLIMADRVLAAGGTVSIGGRGTPLASPASAAMTPQASLFSGLVFTFRYSLVDEVKDVEPLLGLYVLESGIPLVIGSGTVIDPAGDYHSLDEVAVALALPVAQQVQATSVFLIRYQLTPFDVDIFLESVRFDRIG